MIKLSIKNHFKNVIKKIKNYLSGIDKMSGDLLQNKFLITESVSNLCFKVEWIKNEVWKQIAMDTFRTACFQIYETEYAFITPEPNIVETNDEPSLDIYTWFSLNDMNDTKLVDIEIN